MLTLSIVSYLAVALGLIAFTVWLIGLVFASDEKRLVSSVIGLFGVLLIAGGTTPQILAAKEVDIKISFIDSLGSAIIPARERPDSDAVYAGRDP